MPFSHTNLNTSDGVLSHSSALLFQQFSSLSDSLSWVVTLHWLHLYFHLYLRIGQTYRELASGRVLDCGTATDLMQCRQVEPSWLSDSWGINKTLETRNQKLKTRNSRDLMQYRQVEPSWLYDSWAINQTLEIRNQTLEIENKTIEI